MFIRAAQTNEVRYNPIGKFFPAFNLVPRDTHLVAVRLSYHSAQKYQKLLGDNSVNFGFGIGLVKQDMNELNIRAIDISKIVTYTAALKKSLEELKSAQDQLVQ